MHGTLRGWRGEGGVDSVCDGGGAEVRLDVGCLVEKTARAVTVGGEVVFTHALESTRAVGRMLR